MEANRSDKPATFSVSEPARGRASRGRVIACAIIGVIVFVVVVVTAIVLAVIIPKQISYLEYYEYGLKREKESGTVLFDRVYTSGRYWFGEDYDFIVFRAGAYDLNLQNVHTFSKDRLEVLWDLRMQYFIRKDELPDLYQTYSTSFKDVIRSAAIDTLKAVMTNYLGLFDRAEIEEHVSRALRERLAGTCCRPDCNQTDYELACFRGCKLFEVCDDTDMGLGFHVDLKYVELGVANHSDALQQRVLAMLTMPEQAMTERFLQEAIVIRKETDAIVQNIRARTEEILTSAAYQCNKTIEDEKLSYVNTLQIALIKGLQNSITQFNLTEVEKTASLTYIKTLIDQREFRPNITFIHGNLCEK